MEKSNSSLKNETISAAIKKHRSLSLVSSISSKINTQRIKIFKKFNPSSRNSTSRKHEPTVATDIHSAPAWLRHTAAEVFTLFDTDGDQVISKNELGRVLTQIGQNPSEHDLNNWIKQVDSNGKGVIDFEGVLCFLYKNMKEYDIISLYLQHIQL